MIVWTFCTAAITEGRPSRLRKLDEGRANEEIARKIYKLCTAARMTQTQLAKLIGTTASVICRLEDADYEGHSLAMLRRLGPLWISASRSVRPVATLGIGDS